MVVNSKKTTAETELGKRKEFLGLELTKISG